MFKRNLWKIVLSCAVVAYAITSILPLQDTPFADYMKSEVGARNSEFDALMREATERVASGSAQSEYVALKQIAAERDIDLSGFFPQLELESSLRNTEKRNDILLDHLLKESKGQLQLGLDLKGGVAFTLEVADSASQSVGQEERREQLDKAIEIIGDRINGLGVAEPIIRPVGEDRIEVQLPSVSTKDNPEIVDSVKKPARLDFRRDRKSVV